MLQNATAIQSRDSNGSEFLHSRLDVNCRVAITEQVWQLGILKIKINNFLCIVNIKMTILTFQDLEMSCNSLRIVSSSNCIY